MKRRKKKRTSRRRRRRSNDPSVALHLSSVSAELLQTIFFMMNDVQLDNIHVAALGKYFGCFISSDYIFCLRVWVCARAHA